MPNKTPARVKLIAQADGFPTREFVFGERTTCIVGRAKDCQIRVPEVASNRTISRYHCMIDINPPEVFVRDFGSLNGTYVNGELIGKRSTAIPMGTRTVALPAVRLGDGDQVRIRHFTLSLSVEPGGDATSANVTEDGDPVDVQIDLDDWEDSLEEPEADVAAFRRLLAYGAQQDDQSVSVEGYTIEQELGRGGMGRVYLAHRDSDQSRHVIKLIHPEVQASQWHVESLLREAKNTLALRHKNIVEVRDWGWRGNLFFLAIEYCAGGTLAEYIQSRGPLSPTTAVDVACQILAGLAYAHGVNIPDVRLADGTTRPATGLIHRDLSPENVLLSGRPGSKLEIKIADFGLSKVFDLAGLSGFTRTGMYAGKPNCICRQQVLNYRECQPEVDVWAAAACLYHMLTGAYPREFEKDRDVWLTVLQDAPVKIRQRNANVPVSVAKVIDLALNDQQDLHFQSAADLASALKECAF